MMELWTLLAPWCLLIRIKSKQQTRSSDNQFLPCLRGICTGPLCWRWVNLELTDRLPFSGPVLNVWHIFSMNSPRSTTKFPLMWTQSRVCNTLLTKIRRTVTLIIPSKVVNMRCYIHWINKRRIFVCEVYRITFKNIWSPTLPDCRRQIQGQIYWLW